MASNSPAKTLFLLALALALALAPACSKPIELTPVAESVTLTSEPKQGTIEATVKWGDILTGTRKGNHWKVEIDAAKGYAASHELLPYPIAGEPMYVVELGNPYAFKKYELGTKLQVTKIDATRMGVVKDGVVAEAIEASRLSSEVPDTDAFVAFAKAQLKQDAKKGIPAARAFLDAGLALDANHEGAKTWAAALASKKTVDMGALYLTLEPWGDRSQVSNVESGSTAVVWAPRASVVGAGDVYVGRVVHVVEVDLNTDTARIQWDPAMPRVLSLSEHSGTLSRAPLDLPESPAEGTIAVWALGAALPHARALFERATKSTTSKEETRLLLVAAGIDRDERVMSALLAAALRADLPDAAMWALLTPTTGVVPHVEDLALVFGCEGEPHTSECLERIEADYPCAPCEMPQEEFDAAQAKNEEDKAHFEKVVEEARANYPGSRYLILTVRNERSTTIRHASVPVVETRYRMTEGCGSGVQRLQPERSAWDLRLGAMGAGEVVKVWVPVTADEDVAFDAGNAALIRRPGSPDGGPDCTCDCSCDSCD